MKLKIEVTGAAPLLMHNNTLADALSDPAKQLKKISAKRTKTDEDHIAMRRIEFEAGLYIHPEAGPYMPGANLAASLLEAAKISRRGQTVKRGLIVVSPINRLEYDGPRDVSGLWNNLKFRHVAPVKNQGTTTVMRCRPVFMDWAFTATALINQRVLTLEDLADIADAAGEMAGLGDWRPWHGRFTAKVSEA
jgi:hypothetical protein